MKISPLIIALFFIATLAAEDLVTVSGKRYTGVSVSRIEPNGISISHDAGIAKIPFTDLSEELQKKYGYDPQKAAAVSKPTANPKTQFTVGGFLDIPWGTSRARATEIMLQREGIRLVEKESNQQKLFFEGGTFSDLPVDFYSLEFFDNQFYQANVIFKLSGSVEETFSDLNGRLYKKYGAGSGEISRLFKIWSFPKEESNYTESILLFGGRGNVSLAYTNKPLKKKAEEAHQKSLPTKDL